jgi:uncharacterized membrane protein
MAVTARGFRFGCLTRAVGVSKLFGRDGPILVRVVTAAAVGVAAAVAVGVSVGWPYAPAAGWIVTAIIYLVSTWALIAHMNGEQTREHACRPHEQDATRGWSHAIMLLASLASLAGVGYLLMAETSKGGDLVAAAVGILSVAASWFAVHTVFALRYARLYYEGGRNGIDFNQEGDPTYGDFAYLAFTVGMTYQVSDTDLKARNIRTTALSQAMLSFLLGAIILAITINLVAGLASYSN